MADFRALCVELTEFVARLTKHYYEPAELLTRARAALAEEPAVPEGRKPAAVIGQPSDEEIIPTPAEKVMGPTYDDLSELCSEHGLDVDSWSLERFDALWEVSRAVLARWGTPNLAETRRSLMGWDQDAQLILRAAELLQRQMLVLVPVSVSERLPGPGDCDADGRCWWYAKRYGWEVHHHKQPRSDLWTHWLSTQTLPLPEAE